MKRLQIQLPDDLHLSAKIKAAKTETSMAEICRRALTAWLQDDHADRITELETALRQTVGALDGSVSAMGRARIIERAYQALGERPSAHRQERPNAL